MEANEAPCAQTTGDTESELIPLTMASPGKEMTLVAVNGGAALKTRLYGMGLTPGVHLKILTSGPSGPFLVSVRSFKVALGYGIAKKLLVH